MAFILQLEEFFSDYKTCPDLQREQWQDFTFGGITQKDEGCWYQRTTCD